MRKIFNFLDHHRILLILLILIFIIIIFFSFNTYLFFHHRFKALECTKDIDETYCYHEDIKILVNPKKAKETFFKKYDKVIRELKNRYNLDEFNNYTAYYYLSVSQLHYEVNSEYKILETFFESYVNTYNIKTFYYKNTLYFDIFYHYKIN